MKRSSFIISAIILTAGGVFAKAIGALYKIPLTNILGSNGIGLYYLVFPVYSLVITLSSGGMSVAVATEVAKCRKLRHRYNEQKILQVSIVISFGVSLALTILTLALFQVLSEAQGNVNASVSYRAIAPAIILSTIIATMRGYFQGIENVVPTTVSLIIEQVTKLTLGLILAHKLSVYGINYAVLGAILGVTISEVVAVVIIVINFIVYKGQLDFNYRKLIAKKRRNLETVCFIKSNKRCSKVKINSAKYYPYRSRQRYGVWEACKRVLKLAFPSTLSALILPVATLIDSFLIINTLVDSGVSTITSTALYGLYGGVVQSLLSIPIIIISALATALVPSLSGLVAHNDTNEIKNRVNFFIKITWIISMLAFVLIFVFADGILRFLYGGGLHNKVVDEFVFAVRLLKINSISIIYSAFFQTFTTILQVTGGASVPFWVSLLALPIRIVLLKTLVLVPKINIFGAVISSTVYLGIVAVVLVIFIKKKIQLKYNLFNHLLKPMIVGIVLAIIGSLGYNILCEFINYMVALIVMAILLVATYLIFAFYGKFFTPREKKYFFSSSKISKSKRAELNKE